MTEDEIVGWYHQLNDMNLSILRETVKERETWCAAGHRVAKIQTLLSDRTTTITNVNCNSLHFFL